MGSFRLVFFFLAASLSALTLTSPAFVDKGDIPTEYGCMEHALSPELVWDEPPKNTAYFAIVIKDLTTGKVHGKLFNIPKETRKLQEGAIPYIPLCPLRGKTHLYEFTLYALDGPIVKEMEIDRRTITTAKLTGHYKILPRKPLNEETPAG